MDQSSFIISQRYLMDHIIANKAFMKKIKTKFIAVILIVVFSSIPLSPFREIGSPKQANAAEINGYQEWNEDKTISGAIFVDPDSTLVIGKGVNITMDGETPTIYVEGTLIIKGTAKNPVKFRRSQIDVEYSIFIEDGGKVIAKNIDVSGGGRDGGAIFLKRDTPHWNNALAWYGEYQGAFNVFGGILDVEGGNFHDNYVGITTEYGSTKVNRSKFSNNTIPVINGSDFKYNWWGSDSEPKKCDRNSICLDNEIRGNPDTSFWTATENFHDPVVIIPGIMGSQKILGKWKMDPIFHTYKNLFKEFKENGYEEGRDLFEFPYEWRDSNVENAKFLRNKINDIKQEANWPKVDIVAHSMGGLLAREYIESDLYQDDVDQFVALGTPHAGAPKDYLTWEGGDISEPKLSITDEFIKEIFKQEAKEKGYSSLFDYIRKRPISSVRELLPTYDYLYDVADKSMREYPSGYPTNPFLENLNSEENISKIKEVEFHDVIGELNDSTITKIRAEKPSPESGSIWEHGRPENYDSLFGDHGLEMGNGDGTVPTKSAKNISSDEQIVLESNHLDLPSKAADDVYEILTNKKPEHKIDYAKIAKIIVFLVFSPVDIQVISPDGKRVGKNFETGGSFDEIEGAYYTGSDTDTEFLTIPNPEDGEYKVLTKGTGEGEYNIEISKISEDPVNPENATEVSGIVTGVAKIGQEQEASVQVKENEIITQEKDTVAPKIQITSPEEGKQYLNNENLAIQYHVEDNKTSAENIQTKSYLDESEILKKEIDLSLEKFGTHTLKVSAVDEAGNESQKEASFVNVASMDSMLYNIGHYFQLGFIKTKSDQRLLYAYLQNVKRGMKVIERIKQNSRLSAEIKEKLISNFKNSQIKYIDMIIIQLQKSNKFKSVDEKVKQLLEEDLEYVKNSF